MLKGFFGSLIAAVLFFVAGGVSVALLGTNTSASIIQLNGEGIFGMDSVPADLINQNVDSEKTKTWYFEDFSEICELDILSSGVKTYISPSDDDTFSVSVSASGGRSVSVKAGRNDPFDGKLVLSIQTNDWFFNFGTGNITAIIAVPNTVYDNLNISLSSGSLSAKDIKAKANKFDIGSGNFELAFDEKFTSDEIWLDLGSGSVKIANAATENYNIEMGSGKLDISGLSGSGKTDIGSGKATLAFTETIGGNNEFDLGSGKLNVYIPSDTKGTIKTDIGSGSVNVDCCGVSQTLTDDENVSLNGGGNAEINIDMGSGNVTMKNSAEYERPDMFGDFPSKLVFDSADDAEKISAL